MTGLFAVSLAGHDKGQMYVIMKEAGEYIYVADGRIRTAQKPKKKNKRHIQLVKTGIDESLYQKINKGKPVTEEEIKYAIKLRQSRR